MSSSEIAVKRLRRKWEPDEKSWNDGALEIPWEDLTPPLHKAIIFSLKNIFFFSHATSVQSRTINIFSNSGHSVLVEAPTGSGKTLAILIPLMERILRTCEAYITEYNRPLLRRDIIGIILSPSRVLAEQTFVVGRDLASRFPHKIRFTLCDGAVQSMTDVLDGLKKAPRGAGTFLVTTPYDLVEFMNIWEKELISNNNNNMSNNNMEELLALQDEETKRRYYAKRAKDISTKNKNNNNNQSEHLVQLRGCHNERFVFVIDEADFLFHSSEMQTIVTEFVSTYAYIKEPLEKRRKKTKTTVPYESSLFSPILMDMAFVGATVSTSEELLKYITHICPKLDTIMHPVVLSHKNDFVTQLQNRYAVCEAREFLPLLIQLMNIHSSKKHFIFFNSTKTLRFVEKLFSSLIESECPLLYIKHIFVMYEGMSEKMRLEQYNAFLLHDIYTQQKSSKIKKKNTSQISSSFSSSSSSAEKKNQVYISGWKREGRQPDGKGAILLCTDMAAFGLDVRDVDYVYHFEPPATVQSYVHRIGRVGRMGMRGSSILLLPCFAEESVLSSARERKTTNKRFNTISNTKFSTAELQSGRMTLDDLNEERRCYLKDLCARSELQPYLLPPFAPITSTIRNIIWEQKKLMTLARNAAMCMCTTPQDRESGTAWFDPKLALHALLLD